MVRALHRVCRIGIALSGAFAVTVVAANAQGLDVSADSINRMLQSAPQLQQQFQQLQPQFPLPGTDLRPTLQLYQPVEPLRIPYAPPSRLEAIYSQRAGRPLVQFGYDVLGVPTPVSVIQIGAVQDSYMMGEGDEVVVVLRGQENTTYRQRVNRDGQVILPRLTPISASGRSFAEFRALLERQVAQGYLSTDAYVSLGEVRQIAVFVSGEVRAPGVRNLNAFATPLDAILLSGGVSKTGSLRNALVIRGGETVPIDLYSVLTPVDGVKIPSLRNGDRILVPPLKNTVAISGYVRRPGIYELDDKHSSVNADLLVQLAGGIEIPGNYRYSTTRLEADGTTRLIPISATAPVASGEVLFVDPMTDVALERVTVAGSIRLVGTYPRSVASSTARLIRSIDDLSLDAYTPFAVIVRRDIRLNVRTLEPFSLTRVLSGTADINLQNDDFVYIFNRDEIRLLADAAVREQQGLLALQAQAGIAVQAAPGTSEAAGAVNPQAGQLPNGTPLLPGQQVNPLLQNNPGALAPNGVGPGIQQTPPGALVPPNGPGLGLPPPGAGVGYPQPPYGLGIPQSIATAPNMPGFGTPQYVPQYGMPYGPTLGTTPGVDLRLQAAQQQLTAGTNAIAQAAQLSQQNALSALSLTSGAAQLPQLSVEAIAARLNVSVQALVRVAGDHLVWVLETVRDPGTYIAAEGTTLADMIQTAGGLLRQADLTSIEVTSTQIDAQNGTSRTARTSYRGQTGDFQRVSLQPMDVIRLRSVFTDRENGQVSVSGQVRYPGAFNITRGERLSSLLERAGGLTDQAYPYGAVFTRERAAVAEREGNIRQARSIDAQLATLATTPQAANAANRDTLTFLTSLGQQVRNEPVLGRITITADLAVLRSRPELDVVLEPGDTLYIPVRPATVTVTGEVLNTGSFQFENGLQLADYLSRAGGITQSADRRRTFIVLPDGTAQPVQSGWFSYSNVSLIPPGSTIIVPRDLSPFDLGLFLRDATQITSQLAVTAASVAVIGR
jgi:protein involved in polysaccharide export with SLBB domain